MKANSGRARQGKPASGTDNAEKARQGTIRLVSSFLH